MTKYRIATGGSLYVVQFKCLWFWTNVCLPFYTKEDAERYIIRCRVSEYEASLKSVIIYV